MGLADGVGQRTGLGQRLLCGLAHLMGEVDTAQGQQQGGASPFFARGDPAAPEGCARAPISGGRPTTTPERTRGPGDLDQACQLLNGCGREGTFEPSRRCDSWLPK